jgi:protein-disulfide isomerase
MKKNLSISIGLIAAAVAVLAVFAITSGSKAEPTATTEDRFVRADSKRLSTAADGKVNFVEFLDFECAACRSAYPSIEELRKLYDGKVTFVVRNFPIHSNSVDAAKTAEAAAAQGKFGDMYIKLFETQLEWGDKEGSQEEVFFGYARSMGLDMDKFMTVYNDPNTTKLIERDKADGIAVGVTGTPTFYLNGKKVQAATFEELTGLIDAALAG